MHLCGRDVCALLSRWDRVHRERLRRFLIACIVAVHRWRPIATAAEPKDSLPKLVESSPSQIGRKSRRNLRSQTAHDAFNAVIAAPCCVQKRSYGAGGRTRTGTPKASGPKPGASTNFATPAAEGTTILANARPFDKAFAQDPDPFLRMRSRLSSAIRLRRVLYSPHVECPESSSF